ncbi:hypothetical protein T492DRAFT_872471 [Pavlovales sp. CCMP2436]|nr:hypothetical protein T492DRAFT_872471 [Pavlovales sp. CCMP2436]
MASTSPASSTLAPSMLITLSPCPSAYPLTTSPENTAVVMPRSCTSEINLGESSDAYTGDATYASNVDVIGELTAAHLSVTGDASLGGLLTVTGDATYESNVEVIGELTAARLSVTGDVTYESNVDDEAWNEGTVELVAPLDRPASLQILYLDGSMICARSFESYG